MNWIDSKTRVVFAEFNVYNANEDHFGVCVLSVEFPLTGGVWIDYDFNIHKVFLFCVLLLLQLLLNLILIDIVIGRI